MGAGIGSALSPVNRILRWMTGAHAGSSHRAIMRSHFVVFATASVSATPSLDLPAHGVKVRGPAAAQTLHRHLDVEALRANVLDALVRSTEPEHHAPAIEPGFKLLRGEPATLIDPDRLRQDPFM